MIDKSDRVWQGRGENCVGRATTGWRRGRGGEILFILCVRSDGKKKGGGGGYFRGKGGNWRKGSISSGNGACINDRGRGDDSRYSVSVCDPHTCIHSTFFQHLLRGSFPICNVLLSLLQAGHVRLGFLVYTQKINLYIPLFAKAFHCS